MIDSFRDQNRWLSNFWPAPVYLDGVLYPTVENAYQAAKTLDKRHIFVGCSPAISKKLGRAVTKRDDWKDIKINVMRHLLEQKFHKDTMLGNQLIATGDQEIIEGNTWGDVFWGVCEGVGENHLGRLLMEIREDIK